METYDQLIERQNKELDFIFNELNLNYFLNYKKTPTEIVEHVFNIFGWNNPDTKKHYVNFIENKLEKLSESNSCV